LGGRLQRPAWSDDTRNVSRYRYRDRYRYRRFKIQQPIRLRQRFASYIPPRYHCLEGIPRRENALPALKHNELS